MYSKVIWLYVYMCLSFHLGQYIILSKVPCVIWYVLAGYPFQIYKCVNVNPKLPNYLFPFAFPSGNHKFRETTFFYLIIRCLYSWYMVGDEKIVSILY